jgi:hypothetical protein
MHSRTPLHSFPFSRGTLLARLDRQAEDPSGTESVAGAAGTANAPIRWQDGGLTFGNGGWCYVVDEICTTVRLVRKRRGNA